VEGHNGRPDVAIEFEEVLSSFLVNRGLVTASPGLLLLLLLLPPLLFSFLFASFFLSSFSSSSPT